MDATSSVPPAMLQPESQPDPPPPAPVSETMMEVSDSVAAMSQRDIPGREVLVQPGPSKANAARPPPAIPSRAANGHAPPSVWAKKGVAGVGETILPVSRVQRIIKSDFDVAMSSKEAIFLISKMTERFLGKLAEAGYTNAQLGGRRILEYKDLASTVREDEAFHFLTTIIPPRLRLDDAQDRRRKRAYEEGETLPEDLFVHAAPSPAPHPAAGLGPSGAQSFPAHMRPAVPPPHLGQPMPPTSLPAALPHAGTPSGQERMLVDEPANGSV